MRYSRFKKQMDGAPSVRKPRNTNPPRRRVEKTSTRREKVEARKDSDDAQKIKEEAGVAGSSHHTPVEGSPEPDSQPGSIEDSFHGNLKAIPSVKREPGSSNVSVYASTPLEESTTPASSFYAGADDLSTHDEMYVSFGMPGSDYLAESMMVQSVMGQQQYGMGMQTGMDSYHRSLWDPQQVQPEAGVVVVKREPRWEEPYYQV